MCVSRQSRMTATTRWKKLSSSPKWALIALFPEMGFDCGDASQVAVVEGLDDPGEENAHEYGHEAAQTRRPGMLPR